MTGLAEQPTLVAFSLPKEIDTPAVVVDLDVVEHNVATMAAEMARRGVRLRPHAKTHKSIPIARLQLEAGATGLTVGTLGEAEVFAAAGFDDIFIAYPIWASAGKGERIRSLAEAVRLSIGVDSPEGATRLGEAVRGVAARPEILIEVDSGELRTGVTSAEAAVETAHAARAAGLFVRGVFTHGGHAYQSPAAAQTAAQDEITTLTAAAEALRAAGFEVHELSAGSTPTAMRSSVDGVTEERPGTYVFGDRQQVALGSVDPESVGLVVATTLVSRSVDGQVVIDAGTKALGRERTSLLEGIAAIPGLDGAVVDRAYDYHGIVALGDRARPSLGTILAVVPNHVCPVVNLANELVVTRAGSYIARWPVDARGLNG
jgi:D-serine deaminase-like pyridoxal phosphate-dependent protein